MEVKQNGMKNKFVLVSVSRPNTEEHTWKSYQLLVIGTSHGWTWNFVDFVSDIDFGIEESFKFKELSGMERVKFYFLFFFEGGGGGINEWSVRVRVCNRQNERDKQNKTWIVLIIDYVEIVNIPVLKAWKIE